LCRLAAADRASMDDLDELAGLSTTIPVAFTGLPPSAGNPRTFCYTRCAN
jgi:hypothetical protein